MRFVMRSSPGAIFSPTSEEVERALAAVFARPEFEPASTSPLLDAFGRVLRAVGELLRGILPSMSLSSGSQQLLFWAVVGLLTLGAAAVAARVLRRVGRPRLLSPRQRHEGPIRGLNASAPASAAEWDDRAQALAAAGLGREAAVALYQALLLRLDGRGVVRFDPAKTPGDYRRESRGDPPSQRLLDAFLRRFEPVAFGGRTPDAESFRLLREAARAGGDGG